MVTLWFPVRVTIPEGMPGATVGVSVPLPWRPQAGKSRASNPNARIRWRTFLMVLAPTGFSIRRIPLGAPPPQVSPPRPPRRRGARFMKISYSRLNRKYNEQSLDAGPPHPSGSGPRLCSLREPAFYLGGRRAPDFPESTRTAQPTRDFHARELPPANDPDSQGGTPRIRLLPTQDSARVEADSV